MWVLGETLLYYIYDLPVLHLFMYPRTPMQDNPADFSYFFDTARRRTCYIAPERFVESSWRNADPQSVAGNIDLTSTDIKTGDLTPAMDIFSAGWVERMKEGLSGSMALITHRRFWYNKIGFKIFWESILGMAGSRPGYLRSLSLCQEDEHTSLSCSPSSNFQSANLHLLHLTALHQNIQCPVH